MGSIWRTPPFQEASVNPAMNSTTGTSRRTNAVSVSREGENDAREGQKRNRQESYGAANREVSRDYKPLCEGPRCRPGGKIIQEAVGIVCESFEISLGKEMFCLHGK